jgi:AraC-like DNA-binding protein
MTEQAWSASEPEIGGAIDSLRIDAIGYLPQKSGLLDSRFGFDGVGLVFRGYGTFQVDDGPVFRLEAPAWFAVWPGPRFRYGPGSGASWEERYLCFSGARVGDWVRWRWLDRHPGPRPLLRPEAALQSHRRIAAAFHSAGADLDEAKLEAERLVWTLARDSAPHEDPLERVLAEWRRRTPLDTDLEAEAAKLGMSYSAFRQKVLARTGRSPYQYLLRLRMDEACRRLLVTNDPVKAIADATGFGGVEGFCRAFRRVKGMTPTEFRTRFRAMGS